MKYLALAAVLASCQPAYAEETSCFEAAETLEAMKANGYTITFGDVSREPNIFMAEREDGKLILFVVKYGILCGVSSGDKGVHFSRPPNV